ncbi:MAG: HlyC/CorC family transporter [Deltaproteobacteria bacterium]|nr:HlyC/CorC family transporter [Deltaproteobacteria bacterium]
MEFLILVKIILIFILLCFSAFFSGSETALFSLGSIKLFQLKESNHPKALLIQELIEKPRRLLISILIGNESVNITASALAASLCISFLGNQGKWLAIAIMTPLILVFGEVIPKTIAVSYSEKSSLLVAKPISIFARMIFPIRWVIRILVDRIVSLLGKHEEKKESIFFEEEFKELVEVGHKEGVIEKEEREMIHKILKFGDTIVSSIMTPRADMFTLPHDSDINHITKEINENHFSRVPIYKHEKNNIIGILNAKDLLTLRDKQHITNNNMFSILRQPYFVPKGKKIQEILNEFQEKKIHLALVVNEYGNVIGLVTMEDLLEELFGEIYDEFDDELKEEKKS